MFKLLLAACLGVMTPQGPSLVNCNVMAEEPKRWYQSEEECATKAKALQEQYEEQFKGTPVIGRLSCLSKERLEEIEAKHGEKIKA